MNELENGKGQVGQDIARIIGNMGRAGATLIQKSTEIMCL